MATRRVKGEDERTRERERERKGRRERGRERETRRERNVKEKQVERQIEGERERVGKGGRIKKGKRKGEKESEQAACELEKTRFAAPSCRARRLDTDCGGLDNCRPPKLPLPQASRFQNLLLACPANAARSSFTFPVR